MKKTIRLFLMIFVLAVLTVCVTVPAAADDGLRSGMWGDLTWTLDETTGELTISGEGELSGECELTDAEKDATVSIKIGSGVTRIGYRAFHDWDEVKSVTVSDSVTLIDNNAFSNCGSLKNIAFSENSTLVYIASSAFEDCRLLEEIAIPDSVTVIGDSAFKNCSRLRSVSFSENSSLTTIEEGAFVYCTGLTELALPRSVTSIEGNVFNGCGLTAITIPENVSSIGGSAFKNCTALRQVEFSESGRLTSIGAYAFSGCSDLETIQLPDGLVSIAQHMFADCTSLKSVIIPNSVTKIDACAFVGCTELTEIMIPENVKTVGLSAFESCSKLSRVEFAENSKLEKFDYDPFFLCRALTEVIYHGPICEWEKIIKRSAGAWTETIQFTVTTDGHLWDDGTVTTPPTHLADGVKTFTCTKCDETKTEDVAKLTDHTYGDWESDRDDQHKHTCECGKTEYADHVYDNDKDASCNECGYLREVATGDSNKTQSGCGASVVSGWSILLLLSAATGCVHFQRRRKK